MRAYGSQENVRAWWALLVNRKAYTRQSANPHPETGMVTVDDEFCN